MAASHLRRLAADLTERLEALPAGHPGAEALRFTIRVTLAEADRLEGLPPDNHFGTVEGMPDSAMEGPARRPPSLRAIADALGCTHGFLSQARAGKTRIRRSWARKIAKWRRDMPASAETWPAGWAAEPDED